jgi:hypothetical protein
MLEALAARGAAIGQTARRGLRARVAATLREEAPRGVRVEEVEAGVLLSGRGLVQRSFVDPALRWIAGRIS